MAFVQASGISLAFGSRQILNNVGLNLSTKSRIGLAGANGSGKTTLLKIIAGILSSDSGTVSASPDSRISYLPQSGLEHSGYTLNEEAEKAFDFIRNKISEKEKLASDISALPEGSPLTDDLLAQLHDLEELILESSYYSRTQAITQTLQVSV